MIRRTANGAGQQVSDAFLKNLVLWQTDRVPEIFGFQKLIDVRRGEGGVAAKVAAQVPLPVTLNDGLQNAAPTVSAVHVAGA